MTLHFFKIQAKRLYRSLKQLGFPPIFTIFVIPLIFGYVSNIILTKYENGYLIYTSIGIWLLFLLTKREKNRFLNSLFSKNDYLRIRLIENSFVVIPFTIPLLLFSFFLPSLLLFIIGIISIFVNFSIDSKFVIPTPFSKHPFEFIIGFRRFFILYFICFGITFIAIQVGNFNLGVVVLGILLLSFSFFYEKTEPNTFVWNYKLNPKGFLSYKIKTFLKYSFWSCFPIHLALWIKFPSNFYITFFVHFIGIFFVLSLVFAKYKYYPKKPIIGDTIIIILCLTFLPMYLIIIPKYYREAIKNLKTIL